MYTYVRICMYMYVYVRIRMYVYVCVYVSAVRTPIQEVEIYVYAPLMYTHTYMHT